jgi:hypothetical protein
MPMPGMTASLDKQINTKRLLLADTVDPPCTHQAGMADQTPQRATVSTDSTLT